ncbi:MAG: NADPH:quinone oxidoreductase family protein [Burkholderiales bacterium]
MQAIVCHRFAPVDDLVLETAWPSSPLGPGDVRIAVRAAGVNFPDSLKVEGRYQIKPPLPWIPGSEVAGVVAEVGADVRSHRVGQRVIGIPDWHAGGFATELVLPAMRVLPIDDRLGFEAAAAIPIVYGTSYYALKRRGELKPGETLLVLGAAGGVGLATVQLGKALGARVIAAASTEAKRALAREHGADETIDYTQPDWRLAVKALTSDKGVDVIYDPVGGDSFDEAIRCIGWMGRYLVVGFTSGRIPTLKVNLPLVKGYDVRGVRHDVWRDTLWEEEARDDMAQLLAWQAEGRISALVTATYPLAQAVQAINDITARKTTGKVVLTMP